MDYREDIEQLVKNTFDNFESEVSPDAWTNIQNGLNIQPASNFGSSGNNVSTGAKLTGVASKFTVVNIIGTVAAIVGITASVIYFSSDNNPGIKNPVNESKIIENVPTPSIEAESKEFINNPNEKKPEQLVASLKQEVDNKKESSSNSNTAYLSSTREDVPVASMDKKEVTKLSGNKNKTEEEAKPENRKQIAAEKMVAEKSKDNNDLEEESLNRDAKNETPENPEKKSPEYYLGNVPNVVTPNGDGNNDVFIIEGHDLLNLKVTIYDQATGKIIHQWNNLHGFWDGKTENGQPAKEGMYIYNIFAQPKTGKPITKSGTLQLIRN